MCNIPLIRLLPGSLWPGMILPVRISYLVQKVVWKLLILDRIMKNSYNCTNYCGSFSNQREPMIFHWSLSGSKSPQISSFFVLLMLVLSVLFYMAVISICFFVWDLWQINLNRWFNAKSILKQINSSISNNPVKHKHTVQLSKTFIFQAIRFSQKVLLE